MLVNDFVVQNICNEFVHIYQSTLPRWPQVHAAINDRFVLNICHQFNHQVGMSVDAPGRWGGGWAYGGEGRGRGRAYGARWEGRKFCIGEHLPLRPHYSHASLTHR